MNKIWYIKIEEKVEGPFSVRALKRDRRLSPDTLVWRSGFPTWIAAGRVPELKHLFVEEESSPEEKKSESTPLNLCVNQDEVAVNLPVLPPFFIFLLITILVILFYFFYRSQFL